MSAQEFKPGDRVRCIETWTTHVIDRGGVYTVEAVRPDNVADVMEALVCGDWVPFSYFEKVEPEDKDDLYVEPEPLKEGDWVQVWAKFVREDNLGALVVATPTGARGEGCRNTYASPDAIVRTDDTPPWVKAALPEASLKDAAIAVEVFSHSMRALGKQVEAAAKEFGNAILRGAKDGAS